MRLPTATFSTPIGEFRVVSHGNALCAAEWTDVWERVHQPLTRRFGDVELTRSNALRAFTDPIKEFFAGKLHAIDAVPVDLGGTEFQRSVWEELRRIPAGSPASYRNIAEKVGRPTAVRAVGTANGSNPVAVVVPCHRVIRSSGALGGYGGGLSRKKWLLQHEGFGDRLRNSSS